MFVVDPRHAPAEVMEALYRNDGALTYSELVLETLIPRDILSLVVMELKNESFVKVVRDEGSDFDIVCLRLEKFMKDYIG